MAHRFVLLVSFLILTACGDKPRSEGPSSGGSSSEGGSAATSHGGATSHAPQQVGKAAGTWVLDAERTKTFMLDMIRSKGATAAGGSPVAQALLQQAEQIVSAQVAELSGFTIEFHGDGTFSSSGSSRGFLSQGMLGGTESVKGTWREDADVISLTPQETDGEQIPEGARDEVRGRLEGESAIAILKDDDTEAGAYLKRK